MHPLDMMNVYGRVAEIYRLRIGEAVSAYGAAMREAASAFAGAGRPQTPAEAWRDSVSYAFDAAQRSLIFWDTMRQRGNNWIEHEKAGKPPLLAFDYEMVADARTFARPCNYALVRILPPDGVTLDPEKRAFLIIDPRAGHGPGIGGFKKDSEVGFALKAGHAVYMVIFFPEPVPGQTLADVSLAESEFVRIVRDRHPTRERPVVMGNCQGGWAAMSQNPMYVTFPVSQRDYQEAQKEEGKADLSNVEVRIKFPDGSFYGEVGRINFIDVSVSRTTDTIVMRADVPNPKGQLTDGQLVRVELKSGKPEERIVIPQAALIADQAGVYVFVVEDGKAVVRRVKPGGNVGAGIVVEGIKAGEPVVVEGFEALRPGAAVRATPVVGVKG